MLGSSSSSSIISITINIISTRGITELVAAGDKASRLRVFSRR